MKRKTLFLPVMLAFVCLMAVSCSRGRTQSGRTGGDTLKMKYATGLTVVRFPLYTIVSVADPWHKGNTLHTYVLVGDSLRHLPSGLPEGTLVRTPLKRSVVSTTVHSQLFMDLGAADMIRGICDWQYVGIPFLQNQVKRGIVADCGSSMQPDVERILDLKPDAIFMSPFENSGGYGKLDITGIPLIECADYMEPSPLARAEWMRFYGMLVGHEHQADSIFREVETNYLWVKKTAQTSRVKPQVLMDRREGGVWYVPGGKSTLGQMIADAGGRYVFADDKSGGSLALTVESVVDKAGGADVWLVRYSGEEPLTYKSLLSELPAYRQIKAFVHHRVWACNLQTSGFYEQTPFRPDRLILDFYHIFHPNHSLKQSTTYYHELSL